MQVLAFGGLEVYAAARRVPAGGRAAGAAGARRAAARVRAAQGAAARPRACSTRRASGRCPRFPRTIGIVTSPTGAAIRDMLHVIGRRFGELRIADRARCACRATARAAGDRAGASPTSTRSRDLDVVIVGRGGGSHRGPVGVQRRARGPRDRGVQGARDLRGRPRDRTSPSPTSWPTCARPRRRRPPSWWCARSWRWSARVAELDAAPAPAMAAARARAPRARRRARARAACSPIPRAAPRSAPAAWTMRPRLALRRAASAARMLAHRVALATNASSSPAARCARTPTAPPVLAPAPRAGSPRAARRSVRTLAGTLRGRGAGGSTACRRSPCSARGYSLTRSPSGVIVRQRARRCAPGDAIEVLLHEGAWTARVTRRQGAR